MVEILKMFISVQSYDEKTAENYRNCYIAENRIKRQSAIVPIRFELISVSHLLAVFCNYKSHLEECIAVYRISKFFLDRDL